MKKNRVILSIATLALSISIVGIANAATIKDATKAQPVQSAQHQTYMTQENFDAMQKAMNVTVTPKDNQDTTKNTDKPSTPDNKIQNGKQSIPMGPQMQNNASGDFQKKMTEVHKKNQEQMQKLHKSMPQQSRHENLNTMHAYGHQQ